MFAATARKTKGEVKTSEVPTPPWQKPTEEVKPHPWKKVVRPEDVQVETFQGKPLAQGAAGSGHWFRRESRTAPESKEYMTAEDDAWGGTLETYPRRLRHREVRW